jgi:O-methyltransferase involved in polyketide biosynthesis
MSKIDLSDVSSGYNRSKINSNFQKIEDELNQKVLYRDSPDGEANQMEVELDMNSNPISNVGTATEQHQAVSKGQMEAIIADDVALVVATQADVTAKAANAAGSAANAAGSAANALTSEQNALVSAGAASTHAADAADSAAVADGIATSLAGGTIGFDAVGYDFGWVVNETTYFNRDFGSLV